MPKIKTESDMGCIKIFNFGLACFYNNDYGDFTNTVTIREDRKTLPILSKAKFLGHFTVKETPVYLSSYDCSDDIGYEFKREGRYFVYLIKPLNFIIQFTDKETHS